jgi:hypothetical protein
VFDVTFAIDEKHEDLVYSSDPRELESLMRPGSTDLARTWEAVSYIKLFHLKTKCEILAQRHVQDISSLKLRSIKGEGTEVLIFRF